MTDLHPVTRTEPATSMTNPPAWASPRLCARFWAKVDKAGDCWTWTAAVNKPHGYGVFYVGTAFPPKNRGPHRVAYELLVGPIPKGMTIDHRCLNKLCVNPAHLEVVTLSENGKRGNLEARVYPPPKTHCKRGHELKGSNVYVNRKRGDRSCRECRNQRSRSLYQGGLGRLPRPLAEMHGTLTGYRRYRCRCDACKRRKSEANRLAAQRRRERAA